MNSKSKLIAMAQALRMGHFGCSDEFYNCPAHPDYCGKNRERRCDCGADEHNVKLDELISELKNISILKIL